MDKTENEIIAEFMGGWNKDPYTRRIGINIPHLDNQWYDIDELQYHTSWDWLMPVIIKIKQECYFNFDITSPGSVTVQDHHFVSIYQNWPGGGCTEVFSVEGTNLMDIIYKGVVEFIKWYNSQKS